MGDMDDNSGMPLVVHAQETPEECENRIKSMSGQLRRQGESSATTKALGARQASRCLESQEQREERLQTRQVRDCLTRQLESQEQQQEDYRQLCSTPKASM